MKGFKDIKWNTTTSMNKSDEEWIKGLKDISDYSFTFSIPETKVNNKALKKLCGLGDPEIEKVIFNPPATIVLWSDHTKTIVKCMENDIYSPEAGLALCICKKFLGKDFKKTFRKWIPYGRPEKPETDIPKREKMEKEKE